MSKALICTKCPMIHLLQVGHLRVRGQFSQTYESQHYKVMKYTSGIVIAS